MCILYGQLPAAVSTVKTFLYPISYDSNVCGCDVIEMRHKLYDRDIIIGMMTTDVFLMPA